MDIKLKYDILVDTILTEHKKVFQLQQISELEQFLETMIAAKRIFITGAGREGIAARSFSMRLMHLGKTVYWLWDDTTPGMMSGDLLIAVNGSGNIGHINYLIGQARSTGARIAILTGAPEEEIPKAADVCVFIPANVYKGSDKRTVASIQPMGNLFEQHLFLLFDIIILLLQESMQITAEEMESRHRNIE